MRRRLLRAVCVPLFVAAFAAGVAAQAPTPTPKTSDCSSEVYKGKDLDKKVRILSKPEPNFTDRERSEFQRREITLRAIFCASGSVTDIVVTSGLTDAMNEKTKAAARQIHFTPAEKDGQRVSRLLIVKYIVS